MANGINFGLLGLQEHAARQERKDVRGQQAFTRGLEAVGQAGRAKAERAERIADKQEKRGLLAEELKLKQQASGRDERRVKIQEKRQKQLEFHEDEKQQLQLATGFADVLADTNDEDKPELIESFKKSMVLAGVPQEEMDNFKTEADLNKVLLSQGIPPPKQEQVKFQSATGKILADIETLSAKGKSSDSPEIKALQSDLMVNAMKGAQAQAKETEARIERTGKAEDVLRKEFLNLSKNFNAIQEGYNKIQVSVEEPSAAGDLSLIFGFMKLIDPTSVVREGEQASAQNATGVPGRVRSLWNNLLEGQRMNVEQRKDFVDRAEKLFFSQKVIHDQLRDNYKNLAELRGLNPEAILPVFEQKKLIEQKTESVTNQVQSLPIDDALKQQAIEAIEDGIDPVFVLNKLKGGQ